MFAAVTPFFPKAGPVLFHEFDAAYPLGTLPRIEPRHDEADGIAVVGCQILPVVLQAEEAVVAEEVIDGEVGRETVFAMGHHKLGFRRDCNEFEDFAGRDAFPEVVQLAPACHAVHIGENFDAGQGRKLLPIHDFNVINERLGKDGEIPSFRIERRNLTLMKDGPFIGLDLPWWDPIGTLRIR